MSILTWLASIFWGGFETPKTPSVKIDDVTEAKIWGAIAIVIGAFFIYLFYFS